jgi:tetratricopeptide (TPR) repeat protein
VKRRFGLTLLLVSTLLLSCPYLSYAQRYLDYQNPQIRRLILEGIDATFQEDYPLAQSRFETLIRMAPEDPAGYFFLAASYHAQMIDYESDFKEKDFHKNIEMAKKFARERIKRDKKDAWAYLILGNTYGAKAVYDAARGKWWSGLNQGLSAKSALKQAIKHDPELYDAYVGLGSYHYWASVITKAFWWLPFLGDNREKGISQMKLAYEKSSFSSATAASGLIWIYIEEKEFDRAIGLAQKMQSKYPRGKSFLWAIAQAYYEKRDWHNALLRYQELSERLEKNHTSKNPDQSYNQVECRFYIANSLFNLRRYGECVSVCEKILNLPLDMRIQKRQKAKFKKTQELLEKCEGFWGSKE